MIERIKSIIKWLVSYDKRKFERICKQQNLNLSYSKNQSSLPILYAIFSMREYADYFPFYEQATIVDVGAHYGYFSLFAAQNLAPNSKIYSFVPHPVNASTCRENLQRNKVENCVVREQAVASTNGKIKLFESKSMNHSIVSTEKKQKIEVEATTLRDIMNEYGITTIDFLKLDCEGAEYEIILQANSDTLQNIQTISLEFHDLRNQHYRPQHLIEKFIEEGFKIKKYSFSDTNSASNHGHIIASKLY